MGGHNSSEEDLVPLRARRALPLYKGPVSRFSVDSDTERGSFPQAPCRHPPHGQSSRLCKSDTNSLGGRAFRGLVTTYRNRSNHEVGVLVFL